MCPTTKSARYCILLTAFCLAAIRAPAASAGGPAFSDPCAPTPLEAALLADAGNSQFARHTLIETALIAGGIDRLDLLQAYHGKYDAWRDAARNACRSQDSPRDRAQAILEFMHREILTGGYDPSVSSIGRLLDEGKFNCVSATVLFNALAADCGLTVRAVELRTHAYSIVAIGDQSLIVETTCPTWFRERQLPLSSNSFSEGREVSPAALVAVIYYNRGTDALGKNDFAAAVSCNLRALQLDRTDAPARGNLLAAINNWALSRCATGEYASAIELLDQGRRLDGEHQPFLLNRRHVYRLWIESLIAAGQSEEAANVLAAARSGDPDWPLWATYAGRIGQSRL
jgi:tetratricopeptide (TPR) repeat protein